MRHKELYYKVFSSILLLGVIATASHTQRALSQSPVDPKNDPEYDRLDGTGKSRKKVNVIDWEGNLEIHVYPAGSLIGLGLKIDDSKKDKVMVISYRFDNQPKEPLIRRALLTMPMREGFHAYKDPSATDYDKIVITQNTLGGEMLAYKLEPAPKESYPDGHPARALASHPNQESREAPDVAPAGDVDAEGTIRPFFMQRQADRQMLRH